MAHPTKYDPDELLETPVSFSGLAITDAGADAIRLPNKVAFQRSTFLLNTQADGLGLNITGFTFENEILSLSDFWQTAVYSKIKITDALYQSGTIYAFGDIKGSEILAEDFNDLDDDIDDLQDQVSANDLELADHEDRITVLETEPEILGIGYANKEIETDASGYNTYKDAAATPPEDGTGGSPVAVTVARSASSPLVGIGSLVISKSAADGQGEGASFDFTVDEAIRYEPVQISFRYKNLDANYVSNDVGVYLYDVDNAALIPLSAVNLDASLNGISKFFATGWLNTTSGNYRLIWHVQTTNAAAYDIKIDDIQVKPLEVPTGAIVSDWVKYTATSQGLGTLAAQSVWARRNGGSLEMRGRVTIGTPTAAEARLYFPSLGVVASADIVTLEYAGDMAHDDASATSDRHCMLIEPSVNYLTFGEQSATYTLLEKRLGNQSFGAGDVFSFAASVPIDGWGSNVSMSGAAEDEYLYNSQASINTNDTTSFANGMNGAAILAHTAATYLDVQVSRQLQPNEKYVLEFRSVVDGSWNDINILEVPSLFCRIGSSFRPGGADPSLHMRRGISLAKVAANKIRVYFMASLIGATNYTASASYADRTWANIIAAADGFDRWRVRIDRGHSQSEIPPLVFAKYYKPAADAITVDQPINFSTVKEDTHGCVTTGAAWKFTAKYPGVYTVKAVLRNDAASITHSIYKGGVLLENLAAFGAAAYVPVSTDVRLLAGEYIDLRSSDSSSGHSFDLYVTIARIGG